MPRLIAALSLVVAMAGCSPASGVITSASNAKVGSSVPDLQYVSAEGKASSFNKARYSVTVVAFVGSEGSSCCRLDPVVVGLSDSLVDLPVTVVQFSLPKGSCPHGKNCVEACNLRKGGLMALCDAQRLAWDANGQPAPGSLILIGPENKILMIGSLNSPTSVVAEAKRLGQLEKDRFGSGGRRGIY